MTENKFDIDFVTLEKITIINASIVNNAGVQTLSKSTVFDVEFSLTPRVNFTAKKIRVDFDCTISSEKKLLPTPEIVAKFEITYIFNIENIDQVVKETKEGLQLEGSMSASLSNIVYSTSRGVIYTRCLGTVMGNIILPVVHTAKLLAPRHLENIKQI